MLRSVVVGRWCWSENVRRGQVPVGGRVPERGEMLDRGKMLERGEMLERGDMLGRGQAVRRDRGTSDGGRCVPGRCARNQVRQAWRR